MKQIFFILSLLSSPVLADSVEPYSPLKPHAPLDVHASEKNDMSLTASESREIAGEFRGILSLGVESYGYERWPGKKMSDCQTAKSGEWCGQCELITGHARSYFTFYRGADPGACTLQQLDVHFQVSDPAVIPPLRMVVRSLLGGHSRDEKHASRESGWDGSGWGWKWQSFTDLAYLYMDRDQSAANGEGVARFQWRRSPLFKPK